MNKQHYLLFFAIISLLSCSEPREVSPCFYYWKTVFELDENDKRILQEQKIKRIYLRLFDVDWNEKKSAGVPVGVLRFSSAVPASVEIVPVVYITNKTIEKTLAAEVGTLASNILSLLDGTMADRNSFAEIQIDCDWTDRTREKYFALLGHLKKVLSERNQTISATIRLHQVKYYVRTGIPPVDRGMLMFYNIGKPEESEERNSIFNKTDAAKYVSSLKNYPLQCDVALPIFSWGVQLRGDRVKSLLNNFGEEELQTALQKKHFRKLREHVFLADSSFLFRGEYFMKGDRLSIEEITPELCREALGMLEPYQKTTKFNLALYHLDSSNFKRFNQKDLEEIFTGFN